MNYKAHGSLLKLLYRQLQKLAHICISRCEINPTKIQSLLTSVKFKGVQWYGACRDIPPNLSSTTQKEAQHLLGLFGSWIQHIPHLGVLLQPKCQVKKLLALWGGRNRRHYSRDPGCHAGCSSTWTMMELEVSVADGNAVWSL